MSKLLAITFLIPIISFSQAIKFRQYKPGEVDKYKLTTEVYRDNEFSGKTISISEHRVVRDAGIFTEEIKWISKTAYSGKDTSSFDTTARKTAPYKISLSPQGRVLMPKLSSNEMIGDIADLNTFFLAIAPASNIQKLSSIKRRVKNAEIIRRNFADSVYILIGTDCLEVTQTLLNEAKEYSVVLTNFTSPALPCLIPLIDTISIKFSGKPNNFQMVHQATGDKVDLYWGIESFNITTKIDNKNGQVLEASMVNTLDLRLRYNSSKDLKTYVVEIPVTIRRNLKLELLKEQ